MELPQLTATEYAKELAEQYLVNVSAELDQMVKNGIQPDLFKEKLNEIVDFNVLLKTDYTYLHATSHAQLQNIKETINGSDSLRGLVMGGVYYVMGILGEEKWNECMSQISLAVCLSQKGLTDVTYPPSQFAEMVHDNPWYGFCLLIRLTTYVSGDE